MTLMKVTSFAQGLINPILKLSYGVLPARRTFLSDAHIKLPGYHAHREGCDD
jgi:hypothetical protein